MKSDSQGGGPLVLMVQPERHVHACGTCRHCRRTEHSMMCEGYGGSCSLVRNFKRDTCPLWEPRPPEPQRVGLLRRFWRWLW